VAAPEDLRDWIALLEREGELRRISTEVMMLATYAHVIEELAGTERRPAEAVIRDARDKLVCLKNVSAG
jgi:3-polyprenyl-4-hydroxybenzoate decarboxylase